MKIVIRFFPYVLAVYHLLFSVIAWKYITVHNGDAVRYWFVGQDLSTVSWGSFFRPGTDVIKIFTFPLVKYFHLPFYLGFLIFSLFSGYGFYRLWRLLLKIAGNNSCAYLAAFILLLLPNAHFWTCLIGKEAPLFTAFVLVTDQWYKRRLGSAQLWISFLIIAFIRPHVGVVLALGLLMSIWSSKIVTVKYKSIISGVAFFVAALLYQLLYMITGTRVNMLKRIQYLYELHITKLRETHAHVPLDEYTVPYKIFTFYFRPLPFEKTGWLYGIWSAENAVCLFIFGLSLCILIFNYKKLHLGSSSVLSVFFILGYALMYVFAYANWGLIARTKILALPMYAALVIEMVKTMATKTKT